MFFTKKNLNFDSISKSLYVGGYPYSNFKYVPPELKNPEKYRFNSLGYRCDEFNLEDHGVLTIGCSHTFGWGVRVEERFSSILCQKLEQRIKKPVADWNLALPSKSNDYISRTLMGSLFVLKPKLVVICFTGLFRKEIYDDRGRILDFLLGRHIKHEDDMILRYRHSSWAEDDFKTYDNLTAAANLFDANVNFFKNYKLIESILSLKKINWIYCFLNEQQILIEIKRNLQKDNCIGNWKKLDKVSLQDDHMGVESHKQLACEIFDHMVIHEQRYF